MTEFMIALQFIEHYFAGANMIGINVPQDVMDALKKLKDLAQADMNARSH